MSSNDSRQHLVTAGAMAVVLVLGVLRISGVMTGSASAIAEGTAAADSAEMVRDRHEAQSKQKGTGMTLSAPRLGLQAPVVELGKADDGELDVPRRFDRVGWWSDGIRPGEAGPAVIAGHVDSALGPAVFHRLHELVPGDEVLLRHEDETVSRFVVTRSAQVEKANLPTSEVSARSPARSPTPSCASSPARDASTAAPATAPTT